MKDSARYVKIVEWSDEDGCYVGNAPGLMLGGCHGDDERVQRDDIKSLARMIIDVQQREIEQLRQWRQAWFPG